MIASLRQTDDAYKTMGLLSSQVMQFVALVYADKPSAEVAKDIGAHPFVLSKLMPLARRSSQVEVRRLITIIAKTDQQIKSSGQDPWLLIERCLLEIGQK